VSEDSLFDVEFTDGTHTRVKAGNYTWAKEKAEKEMERERDWPRPAVRSIQLVKVAGETSHAG
jgi:hypothetical protein